MINYIDMTDFYIILIIPYNKKNYVVKGKQNLFV